MKSFIVMQGNKVIDEVFFMKSMSADKVRKSLIEHDGYASNIKVKVSTKR